AKIRADGLRDSGREPRRVLVAADVREIKDGNRGLVGTHWGLVAPFEALDRRNEPISAARNRQDEPRRSSRVTQRLAQLGYRLGQRVIGDVRAGPERLEQRFFRDQGSRMV